ncbi:C6 transcription factor [Seiridium cupressi]
MRGLLANWHLVPLSRARQRGTCANFAANELHSQTAHAPNKKPPARSRELRFDEICTFLHHNRSLASGRALTSPVFSYDQPTSVPAPLDPLTLPGNGRLRKPASQRLLYHYVYRTNKAMATCCDIETPFLTESIPLAAANELVLNVILACTIQGQEFDLTRLVQGNIEHLVSLTIAAVLLCIAETFRVGAGEQALHHLKAARSMIRQTLKLPEEKFNRRMRMFLMERATYMITLAHISMGKDSDQWVLDDTAALYFNDAPRTGQG